jgi:hypothetical protein
MERLPPKGTPDSLGERGSVGRFMKTRGGVYESYHVEKKQYEPKPGDMYYRPSKHHIGFISEVRRVTNGWHEIRSIDGNSGPDTFSPYYDASKENVIGDGFIYQPQGWRRLTNDCWYIKLVDGD